MPFPLLPPAAPFVASPWTLLPRGSLLGASTPSFSFLRDSKATSHRNETATNLLAYTMNAEGATALFHTRSIHWGINVEYVAHGSVFINTSTYSTTAQPEASWGHLLLPSMRSQRSFASLLNREQLGCSDATVCECDRDVTSQFCAPAFCPSRWNFCAATTSVPWHLTPRASSEGNLSVTVTFLVDSGFDVVGIFDSGSNLLASRDVERDGDGEETATLNFFAPPASLLFFKAYRYGREGESEEEEKVFQNLENSSALSASVGLLAINSLLGQCRDAEGCSPDCSAPDSCWRSCGRCPREFTQPAPSWTVRSVVDSPRDTWRVAFVDDAVDLSTRSANVYNARVEHNVDSVYLHATSGQSTFEEGIHARFNLARGEFTTNVSTTRDGIPFSRVMYFDHSGQRELRGTCTMDEYELLILCARDGQASPPLRPPSGLREEGVAVVRLRFDCGEKKIVPNVWHELRRLSDLGEGSPGAIRFVIGEDGKFVCSSVTYEIGRSVHFFEPPSPTSSSSSPSFVLGTTRAMRATHVTYSVSHLLQRMGELSATGLGGESLLWALVNANKTGSLSNSAARVLLRDPPSLVWEDYAPAENAQAKVTILNATEVTFAKVAGGCAEGAGAGADPRVRVDLSKATPRTVVLQTCYLNCLNAFSNLWRSEAEEESTQEATRRDDGSFPLHAVLSWETFEGTLGGPILRYFGDSSFENKICGKFQITDMGHAYRCQAFDVESLPGLGKFYGVSTRCALSDVASDGVVLYSRASL